MKHMPLAVSVLAALAIFAATPAHSQDIEIGVAAAINPDVTGTPPDQEKRLLLVGANVFHNERVVTGEKGQTQMLFVDQSALTIGPDSEVVLDEFVYDPDTETGTIVLNATKGLFRLVGGKISKGGPVVLNTPTATIGIRGGIILVSIAETGATEATFLFGQSMQITSADVTREVTRPGFAVAVIAADQAPSEPAPVSAESLEAALGGLEGSEGESGGAEDTPEDSDVAASGIGEAGSDQDPADIAPGDGPADFQGLANSADNAEDTAEQDEASQNTATQSSTAVNVTGLSGRYKHSKLLGTSAATLGTGDGVSTFDVTYSGGAITNGTFSVDTSSFTPFLKIPGITVGSFSFANADTTSPFGGINGTGFLTSDQEFVFFEFLEADFSGDRLLAFAGVPTTTFTTTTLNALGTKFYALQNDFVLDSNIPFVQKAVGGSLTPGEAEGIADTAIVFDASGSTTAHRAWGHRTIAIVGQGSSQTSVASLAGGLALLDSGNRLFLEGDVLATARLSSTGGVKVAENFVASVDDSLSNDFFGGTAPDYFVLDGTKVDSADAFVSRGLTPSVGAGADQTQFFPNSVALVVGSETVGARTTRQMFGYSGGAMQTYTSGSTTPSSTTLFRNASGDPSDIEVFTSAETNKLFADIDVIGFAVGSGSSFSSSTGEILEADFGDDDVGAFSDATNTSGNSVFVDNFVFGAADAEVTPVKFFSSPGVASSDAAVAPALDLIRVENASEFSNGFLPSGVTVCSCTFLTWGFWGAFIDRSSGSEEIIHLANWVAGEVPAFADITTSGSATYSGHAIGTVFNAGGVYQAIGDFALTFNFASPSSSTGTITNFDTASFNLTVSSFAAGTGSSSDPVLLNPNKFSGSITDAGATGRNGSFVGSFFSGGGDNAAETGGHFQVDNGSDYVASGILAGAK